MLCLQVPFLTKQTLQTPQTNKNEYNKGFHKNIKVKREREEVFFLFTNKRTNMKLQVLFTIQF